MISPSYVTTQTNNHKHSSNFLYDDIRSNTTGIPLKPWKQKVISIGRTFKIIRLKLFDTIILNTFDSSNCERKS